MRKKNFRCKNVEFTQRTSIVTTGTSGGAVWDTTECCAAPANQQLTNLPVSGRQTPYPKKWKKVSPNTDKFIDQTSSYRPFCLFSTMNKAFEALMMKRLTSEVANKKALPKHQLRLKKGQPTGFEGQ